ncbi:MAG: Arm DNA-binding domain-containing protein [Lachnospiraceae bacterium]|nr:Arm DNA-binding domain-containing protein [Lachnospiraceae bacterium]
MPAYKDQKSGKWKCTFYYTDWTGKKVKKLKRGFATKKEAEDWERHFKLEKAKSLDMTFGDFYRCYEADIRPQIRENTWMSKAHIIEKKIPVLTNVDEAVKTAHVENINKKYKKKETAATSVENVDGELVCPKCGSALVLRTAKKGANAGNQFYGCSGYPKCRYIQNM